MKLLVWLLIMSLLLTACGGKTPSEPFEIPAENTEAVEEITEKIVYETAFEEATEIVLQKEPATDEVIELAAPEETEIVLSTQSSVFGKVIVVDAGHGKNPSREKEPIAPESSETKAMFATGTHGKNQTEAELVLKIAKKLRDELTKRGAIVHMTRETEETTLSNIGRAQFANDLNAHISVKIHADGAENSSAKGASMLVPGDMYVSKALADECYRAGEIVLNEYIKATGAKNRGMSIRNDMTGFNWSTVPLFIIEMGFMTNPEEDALMETEEYQNQIVTGLVRGLEVYFAQ